MACRLAIDFSILPEVLQSHIETVLGTHGARHATKAEGVAQVIDSTVLYHAGDEFLAERFAVHDHRQTGLGESHLRSDVSTACVKQPRGRVAAKRDRLDRGLTGFASHQSQVLAVNLE
jgi:hypothetical protein